MLGFMMSVWERLSALFWWEYHIGEQVALHGFRALLAGSGSLASCCPTLRWGHCLHGGICAQRGIAAHDAAPQGDLATALMTSLWMVRTNPLLMLEWALIIVALSVLGFATAFIAMVVVFPLIGHATWHVYRDLVEH